jgi:sugar lactone lactonase YvrE
MLHRRLTFPVVALVRICSSNQFPDDRQLETLQGFPAPLQEQTSWSVGYIIPRPLLGSTFEHCFFIDHTIKMLLRICHSLLIWSCLAIEQTIAQRYYGPKDPRLVTQLTLKHPVNGVSTTPEGRLFVVYARVDGSKGPQVAEYDQSTNTSKAYPNEEWNSYEEGSDPATHFVGVNGQRIGPDGKLWVIDKGGAALGAPVELPYGPKLVVIDLETDEVSRIYYMGNVTRVDSLLDDVRFNPHTGRAYLTDAGSPGLIVLDLASGMAVRVLDGHPSTSATVPVSGEGTLMHLGSDPAYIYADQLEVSPDAKWFYYQPANGGLFRIQTKWLEQAYYNSSLNSNAVLGEYVEPYVHTPSTGGTAIDADGNIYVSDTDSQRIIKICTNGTQTLLVQDPRLLWVDAMWIDTQQRLVSCKLSISVSWATLTRFDHASGCQQPN